MRNRSTEEKYFFLHGALVQVHHVLDEAAQSIRQVVDVGDDSGSGFK